MRYQEHIEQAKPARERVSTVDSEMQTWRLDVIFSNHQICTCTDSRLGCTYVANAVTVTASATAMYFEERLMMEVHACSEPEEAIEG